MAEKGDNQTAVFVFSAMICVVILILIANAKPVESNATDHNTSTPNQSIDGNSNLSTENFLLNKGVLLLQEGKSNNLYTIESLETK